MKRFEKNGNRAGASGAGAVDAERRGSRSGAALAVVGMSASCAALSSRGPIATWRFGRVSSLWRSVTDATASA